MLLLILKSILNILFYFQDFLTYLCIALCISLLLGVEFAKDNSSDSLSHVVINGRKVDRYSFHAGSPSQTVDIVKTAGYLNVSFYCHFDKAAENETEICLVSCFISLILLLKFVSDNYFVNRLSNVSKVLHIAVTDQMAYT